MSMPSPEPSKPGSSETEALDTILVVIDGPADTTRRPRRPDIPLTPPDRPPPPRNPPDDKETHGG